MIQKLMSFSQQLLHRLPNFTCGLFDFNLKLMFSVREKKLQIYEKKIIFDISNTDDKHRSHLHDNPYSIRNERLIDDENEQ
jgi:hypothetical protein